MTKEEYIEINTKPMEARSLSQTQNISNLYNSRNSFRSIDRGRDRDRFRDRDRNRERDRNRNRERENRDRRDRDRRRRRSRSRSGSRSRRRRSRSRSYSGWWMHSFQDISTKLIIKT